MNLETAKQMVIEALDQPEKTRVDFFNSKQIECSYSNEAFAELLKHAINYWDDLINQVIYREKGRIIDWANSGVIFDSMRIPLFQYGFNGNLGKVEINQLRNAVSEFEKTKEKDDKPKGKEDDEEKSDKPKFDTNIWNKECFDLFNYLADNYNATAKKQKFINIWFYLEYSTPDKYVFNFTKDKYIIFIKGKFSLIIKKINKPTNYTNQLVILNNHNTDYLNTLKAPK